jgi:hypothetical protein
VVSSVSLRTAVNVKESSLTKYTYVTAWGRLLGLASSHNLQQLQGGPAVYIREKVLAPPGEGSSFPGNKALFPEARKQKAKPKFIDPDTHS